MKKKILSFIICISLVILSGCGGKKPRSLNSSIDKIPENGVVSSEVLKRLKDDNSVAVMHGESQGFAYEWTIFGSDINEPVDIDLSIDIIKTGDEELEISFNSEKNFGFVPMLSVHLDEKWNSQGALVYAGKDMKAVCSANLTGSEKTVVNFSVSETLGKYIVRGDKGGSNEENLRDIAENSKNISADNKKKITCTVSIECSSVLNHIGDLDASKLDVLPSDGIIFAQKAVEFSEGDSVFDILQSCCKENKVHMEFSNTPVYGSAYVEGIGNLCETDCGSLSGWVYRVNGWYPNYGCGKYIPGDGDIIEWRFTCDLGRDVGCDSFEQQKNN